MILIFSIFFLVTFFVELKYLKMKRRKKRTFLIVFTIMGLSFLYCLAAIGFKNFPSPNGFIQMLFQPLQKQIIG
jgi:Na+/proline symporter